MSILVIRLPHISFNSLLNRHINSIISTNIHRLQFLFLFINSHTMNGSLLILFLFFLIKSATKKTLHWDYWRNLRIQMIVLTCWMWPMKKKKRIRRIVNADIHTEPFHEHTYPCRHLHTYFGELRNSAK